MHERDHIGDTHQDRRRFWCDYRSLEEYRAGMWRTVTSEDEQIRSMAAAVSVLRSRERFMRAALRVIREWSVSTRTELTAPGRHRAWIGASACCLAHGVPESMTRRAWWKLTEQERDAADSVADEVVAMWKDANPAPEGRAQLGLFGDDGKTRRLGQFFCDYQDLEEWKAGMWKHIADEGQRADLLSRAVAFLRDSDSFRAGMREALDKWPISCLFNFTNPSLNKPVWLAHAGACITRGIPEEFMRLGYWELTQEEKNRADRDAMNVAAEWRDPRAETLS